MTRTATNPCRLGAGTGYGGDMVDPARELLEHGELDAMGFDLLAELSVAALQRARLRNPEKGHIPDTAGIFAQCLPPARRNGVTIVTNAGGANPQAAARAIAGVACEQGDAELQLGVIEGDDLTERLDAIRRSGWRFTNMDTGEEDVDSIADRIVAAHAYLGCDGVIEALGGGADVVVGGRLADSALYSGPLMHHYGWTPQSCTDAQRGAALTVGHLLECGGASSGGMTSQWRESEEPWRIGYPLAEVADDGSAVITKLPGSGGIVNEWTIKEQMLYEVHDPRDYRLPDGVVDLSGVTVSELEKNRMLVAGMSAGPPPELLKVQIGYEDGFIGEGRVLLPWPDAFEKAEWCERFVRRRLEYLNVNVREIQLDHVGRNALAGPSAPGATGDRDINEIELRVAVRTDTRAEAELARRTIVHLATAGPVGTAVNLPPPVRKVIALWPTLVPRDQVDVRVAGLRADEAVSHARA
jgi:hypothetical protein